SFQRTFSKVIGQNAKGFFVVKSQNAFNNKSEQLRLRDNRVEVSFFENNMSLKWSNPLVFTDNNAEIQDILLLQDSLYLFYAIPNKVNSKNELFVQRIDTETGMYAGPAKLLDAIEFDRKRNKGMFYIKRSK